MMKLSDRVETYRPCTRKPPMQHLTELANLLRDESSALERQDTATLEALLQKKIDVLNSLEDFAQARPKPTALASSAAPSTDTPPKGPDGDHMLADLLLEIQALNQLNQKIVTRALRNYRTALAVLTGGDSRDSGYDAGGKQTFTHTQHQGVRV